MESGVFGDGNLRAGSSSTKRIKHFNQTLTDCLATGREDVGLQVSVDLEKKNILLNNVLYN